MEHNISNIRKWVASTSLVLTMLLTIGNPISYGQESEDLSGGSGNLDSKDKDGNIFPLGAIGGLAECKYDTNFFNVLSLESDAPGASAGLQVGDRITGVQGVSFINYNDNYDTGGDGPPRSLGEAIDVVEADGGELTLSVLRNSRQIEVTVQLPKRGIFGGAATYPDGNAKAEAMAIACADNLLADNKLTRAKQEGVANVQACIAGLAWLNIGESRHMAAATTLAQNIHNNYQANPMLADEMVGCSNWMFAYTILFMSEYVYVTGDDTVLPTIEGLIEISYRRQDRGGERNDGSFGHGQLPVTYGAGLNIVTSAMLWAWASAEKVGVELEENAFERSLEFIRQGSGSTIGGQVNFVGYNLWGDKNQASGRTGATAMALYTRNMEFDWAENMAVYLGENSPRCQESHAITCLGMVASFLATRNLNATAWDQQMDEWRWYFTLAYEPDGTAAYIPGKIIHGGDKYLGRNGELIMEAMCALILSSGRGRLMCNGGSSFGPNAIVTRSYFHYSDLATALNSGDSVAIGLLNDLEAGLKGERGDNVQREAEDLKSRLDEWLNEQLEPARQFDSSQDPIMAAAMSAPIRKRMAQHAISNEAYGYMAVVESDAVLTNEYEALQLLDEAKAFAVASGFALEADTVTSEMDEEGVDVAEIDERQLRSFQRAQNEARDRCLRSLYKLVNNFGGTRAARDGVRLYIEMGFAQDEHSRL